MFGLFAPRLTKFEATLLSSRLAAQLFDQRDMRLKHANIRQIYDEVADKNFPDHKITNKEGLAIYQQAMFWLDNYEEELERHKEFSKSHAAHTANGDSVSYSEKFWAELMGYQDDTPFLDFISWKKR